MTHDALIKIQHPKLGSTTAAFSREPVLLYISVFAALINTKRIVGEVTDWGEDDNPGKIVVGQTMGGRSGDDCLDSHLEGSIRSSCVDDDDATSRFSFV